MAELDNDQLKKLDKTLASMNQRLQGLEQTLAGVKEGMVSAFNPAIIKSFTDSMRGLKAIRLIEADEAVKDIKKIKDEIDSLESKYKGEKPLKKGESLGSVREELSRYKALMREIDKGSEQRAIELANIRQKERDADLKAAEVVVSQREQAERRKAEIARAWAEQEAKEKAQREKMKTAAEKAAADERTAIAEAEAKKKLEIAKAWSEQDRRRYEKDGDPLGEIAARKGLTGTRAALEDQKAVNEWRKQTIEEERKAARERTQQAKEVAAIQRKADSESMANQRRQIQIKSQLAAIDKNRIAITKQSSDREKALAAQQQADYRSLQSELSKLIARQKELNAVSQGSGRRAKDRLSTYTISESEKAMRRYADAVRNAHREQKKLGDETNKMLPTLQRLASAFGIAFSVRGLAQFGKKLVETRGEFERQQVALRSILQNKQLADEIWDKTMQAALQSPFTAMQLTTYTKQLAAYRIETNKLFETTKRLADVSAGLGVDMQRLILAYGQVKAANYLRASEIRQFTEAGVNVLGELSQYLSEVNGKFISTAEVMEMVTKRMVTFEDVEAIFKRLTDQGGIFYDMQYVQSQTVRGQIAKLHDAYDQMLNNIGKANEGILKNMVSILNSIVKNWREWKTVLDLIAWPLIISSIAKFSRGLFVSATAAKLARTNVVGLEKAGTKLQLTLKKLNATISKNPWILLVTAIAAATVAAINHAKAVKAVNNEYDELSRRALETQNNLKDIEGNINKNNEILSDPKRAKEHNAAQKENAKLIAKLKEEYPQLADAMSINTKGIIAMGDAMERYNNELDLNIRLNELSKASFFNNDLGEDIGNYEKGIKSQQDFLTGYKLKAEDYILSYKNLLFEQEQLLRSFGPGSDLRDSLEVQKTVEEYNEIIKALTSLLNTQTVEEFNEAVKNLPILQKLYTREEVFRGGMNGGVQTYKSYAFEPIGAVISGESEVEKELEQNMSAYENYLVKMAKLNKDFKWDEKDWALPDTEFIKKYNKQIQDMLFTIDPKTEEVVIGQLGKDMSRVFIAASEQAQTEAGKKGIMKILLDFLQKRDNLTLNVDYSGGSTTHTPLEDKPEKTKENASKLISLIKEMRSEYDKLSKSAYGYAKSEEKVRDAYAQSVEKILGKAGITDYDFTTNEGMIAALDKVLAYANKLGPEAAAEVQKYIDQLETEIEINAQVRIREDFAKEMEKAFNDYELTVELDKLNISPEAAKDWLNFDYTSLGDMLNSMNDFANKLIEKNDFDEEDAKAYQQWAKKIEDQIYKTRKEKAKEYSKYLETELSERAKLEMEYAKKVAEVKASPVFQGEQEDAILDNMNREFNEKLQELTWKSFKESDFYVEMMEDLTSIPAEYSALMLTKLNEILMHPEKLSPRALKEAINARQKIMEARRQMNPALAMSENLRSYRDFYTNQGNRDEFGLSAKTSKAARKEIQALIIDKSKELSQLEEEINIYDDLIGEIENYNNLKKEYDEKSQGLAGDPEEEISQRQELLECLEYEQQRYEDLRDAKQRGEEIDEEEFNSLANEINVRQQNITQLNAEIKAYRDAEVARKALGTAYANLSDNAQTLIGGGEVQIGSTSGITSGNIKSKRQATADKKDNTKSAIQRLKDARKNEEEFAKAWHEFNAQLNDTIGKVKNMGNAFYDTFEALGGETDALTEGWKEFGNTMVDVITQALSMIPTLVTGFTAAGVAINSAMGIIGLIAEAIQLVIVLVGAFAKLHDAGYEKEIENQQKIIDNLQRAYTRLEKEIEKTWDTASYIRTYNEETQNLYEQIEALNKQMAAEEAKKNTDSDKIQDYKDKIQDAEDELEELKQKQIEVFGGIGKEGYRDAAQGFVDAWKSAFLETGDGLQGLQDHFDEFLNDWFVKQATMRIAANNLEPLFRKIDQAVDQNGLGGANVTWQELEEINDLKDLLLTLTNEQLKELAGVFGIGGEGSLSGLAAGIQGMTEEQANILEAYWNDVRMDTNSINENVATIVSLLSNGTSGGVGGGRGNIFGDPNVETNPMLKQLDLIAVNTAATHRILESVTKSGHSQGGYGIKVFAD